MKILFKKILCSLLFVCLCLSLGMIHPAHASVLYKEVANLECIEKVGYYRYQKSSLDINDDGTDENFEVRLYHDRDESATLRIYMNDQLVLSCKGLFNYDNGYIVDHIVLANGIHYFHIYDVWDDGSNRISKMYYYDVNTNSFKFSYDTKKEYHPDGEAELKYVQNNTLKFIFLKKSNEVGLVYLYLNSVTDGTTFKRKSYYGKAKMYDRSNTLKAKKSIVMTTKPGGKKKAYTLKKNQKAKVVGCYYNSKMKLWLKFKKGKKVGWFNCHRSEKASMSHGVSRFFYDVNFAI